MLTDESFRLWQMFVVYFQTIRDTLIRSFAHVDSSEVLKQSSRREWPVVLHNLCYLHGAIHVRRRLGYAGWTLPLSLSSINTEQIHVIPGSFDASNFNWTLAVYCLVYFVGEINVDHWNIWYVHLMIWKVKVSDTFFVSDQQEARKESKLKYFKHFSWCQRLL